MKNVDENEIKKLFEGVSKNFDIVPEGARKFFELFVRETLKYRDEIASSEQDPLTVAEVQKALDLLEGFIKNPKIPGNTPARSLALLKRWIAKLNEVNQAGNLQP